MSRWSTRSTTTAECAKGDQAAAGRADTLLLPPGGLAERCASGTVILRHRSACLAGDARARVGHGLRRPEERLRLPADLRDAPGHPPRASSTTCSSATGDQTIEAIEYLPSEQLPLAEGAKLSILDVRCKDRAGTTFVVEMQLIHHPGFINRVVYNACKAYAGQLKASDWFTKLTDVVAISICDFELWPDAKQDENKAPPGADAEPVEHDRARLEEPRALAGSIRVPGAAQDAGSHGPKSPAPTSGPGSSCTRPS